MMVEKQRGVVGEEDGGVVESGCSGVRGQAVLFLGQDSDKLENNY